MKFERYNHAEIEPQIQDFWEKKKVLEKLKENTKDGKKFSFLQGPPYTSGKVHLGTAWNTALKDMAVRYKRAQGFNVWDRNGYDVHGLPTAHKVMAKHELKSKEDIEKYGVGKFIKECIKFSLEMGEEMTKTFKRIGVTLDYSDSYMALKNEYMEGEWWLIKKAWENKRLYRGKKVMTWCAGCETALAKHECEYEEVEENSIFLKFKVKGKKNEYLLIWTTTPWTIPFNLGIMVNPELDYVKAEVDGEIWILGKSLVAPFIQSVLNKSYKFIEEVKGEELEGLEYEHPLTDKVSQYKELKEKHPKVHTVVLSKEFVDFTAGTGLVHMAPGCGPEDYEVGRENDIPAFNTLNEKGEFDETIPDFQGWVAKKDDLKFIKALEETGNLLATTKVEHDYPHCWRCHQGVIFKTTKQWFFKIEDLKNDMVNENKNVHWVPKTQAFDSWTTHLKDNSITRQRYWGTPVPIWKCDQEECKELAIIGSRKELEEKGCKVPKDIHRPWIDEVKWECKCGKGKMTRISDILDVWIDAGTAAWNCFYYPEREDYFKDFYPADLILEATEQVRLWFSMLSICSQISMGGNPYKNVYMHGMLNDIDGKKMSKSIGNIISPYELVDKHGADVMRYYMCGTNAGQDVRFSWDECALKERYLQIFWNVHKLLINLCKDNKINPLKIDESIVKNVLGIEEKYILSKLNSTIKKVTELYDDYHLDETIAPIEELFLELSRTYIQMVREKSSLGSDEDKEIVVYTLYKVVFDCLRMFNIVSPFICETMYLNLKDEFNLKKTSITHYGFSQYDEKMIDEKLEGEVETAKQVIQSALYAREKAKLGLRWPVQEVLVVTKNDDTIKGVETLSSIIKKQVNARDITILNNLEGVKTKILPDSGKIGMSFGELTPHIVAELSIVSPESVLEHLDKENVYPMKVQDKDIKLTRDMIKVQREVPEKYQESEFKFGQVYINTVRTEELEAEGYARELARNVQQLRKKSGLEKLDEIILFVKVSEEMKSMLEPLKEYIEEKTGAEKMEISCVDPVKKHTHTSTFKVKREEFDVWIDKV